VCSESTVTSDGVALVVHELGGSGRIALLAHATGFHGTVFLPLAHHLEHRFRAVAPDLRGHGHSGAPADLDFDWSGFGLDVLAIVDAVAAGSAGDGRPVGIGHSLGGTALLLAEAARPGTFAALFCYEPILVSSEHRQPRGASHPFDDAARRRRDNFASREEARARYAGRPPLDTLDPEVLDHYVIDGFRDLTDGTVQLRCEPENEGRVFDAGVASDALDHLAGITCPVTLGRGNRSTGLSAEGVELAQARLSDARLVTIDGVGHFGPLEDPVAVAASVLDALAAN